MFPCEVMVLIAGLIVKGLLRAKLAKFNSCPCGETNFIACPVPVPKTHPIKIS